MGKYRGKLKKHRQLALRIALYIKMLGEEPVTVERNDFPAFISRLHQQYQTLRLKVGLEVAEANRAAGRAAIRKQSFEIATAGLVAPIPTTPRKTVDNTIRLKTESGKDPEAEAQESHAGKSNRSKKSEKRQKLRDFFARPGQQVVKCPRCRMRCGLPKKSWPTREMAEEILEKNRTQSSLDVYECPHQPGYFHLGHSRTKTQSQPRLEEEGTR